MGIYSVPKINEGKAVQITPAWGGKAYPAWLLANGMIIMSPLTFQSMMVLDDAGEDEGSGCSLLQDGTILMPMQDDLHEFTPAFMTVAGRTSLWYAFSTQTIAVLIDGIPAY